MVNLLFGNLETGSEVAYQLPSVKRPISDSRSTVEALMRHTATTGTRRMAMSVMIFGIAFAISEVLLFIQLPGKS